MLFFRYPITVMVLFMLTLGLQVLSGISWASGEAQDIKQPDSALTAIEKLYFKNEIREQDIPRLEKPIGEDNPVVDGNHCKGEWFHFEKERYMISRTSCNDARLAFAVFKIAEDKKAKFIIGFYDSDGDGIFERINDWHDRPLPEWIKKSAKAKEAER